MTVERRFGAAIADALSRQLMLQQFAEERKEDYDIVQQKFDEGRGMTEKQLEDRLNKYRLYCDARAFLDAADLYVELLKKMQANHAAMSAYDHDRHPLYTLGAAYVRVIPQLHYYQENGTEIN